MSQTPTPPDLSEAFREAFRCHPAGVAVITAEGPEGPVAITVSSLISVSAAPPTVAFSLSSRSTSSGPILQAETMVIHLLRYSDLELARLASASGSDRFDGSIPWEKMASGEPKYSSVSTWFRAKKISTMQVEGAVVVAAELIEGAAVPHAVSPADEGLVYMDRRWLRLGAEE